MMHTRRSFQVSEAGSAEDLAEKLTGRTWTLCTGFRLGGYLFLNDSTSEDGAQEFAVVKLSPDPGGAALQAESITYGWCDYQTGLDFVRRCLAGEYDPDGIPLPGLTPETSERHGRCSLCT